MKIRTLQSDYSCSNIWLGLSTLYKSNPLCSQCICPGLPTNWRPLKELMRQSNISFLPFPSSLHTVHDSRQHLPFRVSRSRRAFPAWGVSEVVYDTGVSSISWIPWKILSVPSFYLIWIFLQHSQLDNSIPDYQSLHFWQSVRLAFTRVLQTPVQPQMVSSSAAGKTFLNTSFLLKSQDYSLREVLTGFREEGLV